LNWLPKPPSLSTRQCLPNKIQQRPGQPPKLLGDQVSVASLDADVGLVTNKLMYKVYAVDAMIGTIAGSFEKNQRDATEQLAKLYPTLKALHDEIVETLQEIMTGKKPLASKIA